MENNPFKQLNNPQYSEFIHKSRYARWLSEQGRREDWNETIERYILFWKERFPNIDKEIWKELYDAIYNLEVMPSMRALMTAGPALERDHVAGYNCAYIAVDTAIVLDEIMYILMCGTGDGYSVEKKYTNKLPIIAETFFPTETKIIPRDSKLGWASSYRELISLLYSGKVPDWDFSKIRPAGAPLKTFGGRASGPEPLDDLFKFTVNSFRRFAGKKLPSIVVSDLICKIAEIVVVGGVRRSALICLSDLDDKYLRYAKSPQLVIEYTLLDRLDNGNRKYSVIVDDAPYGERSLILELDDWESEKLQKEHKINWWHTHPERALANISIAYENKPSLKAFMNECIALYESKSGERGIYNRFATNFLIPERRKELDYTEYGCNPCSEINLRGSGQFCNLTEVIVRSDDNMDVLLRKVRLATILGTLQSTLTDFRYLRKQWKKNCELERLLGVSLTGIMDHPVLNNSAKNDIQVISEFWKGEQYNALPTILRTLKIEAINTNKIWAKKLGINQSTAITCVKPSGTVSQLVDTASGIHPRYSPYYIRTVRGDKKDPLTQFLISQGVPNEDAFLKEDSTTVFSFPMISPEGSVFRDDRSAIEQLKLWKIYQLFWCEHKPSITVYVKEDEWMDVFAWVYNNFDIVSGISFLPHSDHNYKQAPYQEITEEECLIKIAEMVEIDWAALKEWETEDTTINLKELACTGDACEIV